MPITPPIIPRSESSAHWYTKDGQACHEVARSDGQGMRPTTLRDARKLGLLPSVTTILKTLHKQALVEWLIETACLSVLTAPKLPNEELDAFVKRILTTERQQDQEAQKARDLGTAVHVELESRLSGWQPVDHALDPYVLPALEIVNSLGRVVASEKIVVGNGYAGTLDALLDGNVTTIVDFKTCKKLPKESWDEHKLQLSAYAVAAAVGDKKIQTANIYISTTNPGECVLCLNHDWSETYFNGFRPLVQYWQWLNSYIARGSSLASTEDAEDDRLYDQWNKKERHD